MLSADEQKAWLEEDNEKIVICDIQYYNTTINQIQQGFFSNYPYIMQQGDSFTDFEGTTRRNVAYEDNLLSIPNIISKIGASVTISALEFLNSDGEFDPFIDYAWEGHPINIYIGDKNWVKDDFILILSGISSLISSTRYNIMSLDIRDKKEVFNKKVQETLLDDLYAKTLYADYLATYDTPAFIKTLDTLLYKSTPIEVKLDGVFNAADIALATQLELNNIAGITATVSSNIISVAHSYPSALPDSMLDGYNDYDDPEHNITFDTNFSFGSQGGYPDYLQELDTTNTVADLNGKYFQIFTLYRPYYVWYNIDNGSEDPKVIIYNKQEFYDYSDNNPDGLIITPEPNINTPVPICLGKCFNIEPKLIDSFNHVYQVHEGSIAEIREIRSNGVILNGPNTDNPQYEVNTIIGCFRLLVHDQTTQLTCDIIGASARGTGHNNTYNIVLHSAAMLVEWLALEKTSLTSADICSDSFPSVKFTNTDPLGLYIRDETDIAPLIIDIMSSVGGFIRFHRTCLLQITRIVDPEFEDSELLIDEDLIVEKGLSLGTTEIPKNSVTLGYNKNWTIQSNIASSITESSGELLELFTNEYSSAVAYNTTSNILEQYPLAIDEDLVGTLICDYFDDTANAQKEADRRRDLRNKKRTTYKIKSTTAPFTLAIGDTIEVNHRRFGFSFTKKALIIGMNEKPTNQRIDLEVWL